MVKKGKRCAVFRLIALSISACLALTACTRDSAELRFSPVEHGQTAFSDMVYERPDADPFYGIKNEILELTKTKENEEAVVEKFQLLRESFDTIRGMGWLVMILSDQDTANDTYRNEEAYNRNLENQLSGELLLTAQAILRSPCGEYARESWGRDFCKRISEMKGMTPEGQELSRQETELLAEYSEKSGEQYFTDWKGTRVGEREIDELYADGTISGAEWNQLNGEIFKAQNEALGPIYLELLQVRTKMASLDKEEDYLTGKYDFYLRDYRPLDAANLYEEVQRVILPLLEKLMNRNDTGELDSYIEKTMDAEKMLAMVKKHLAEFGPEMQEAFGYMKKFGLYDLEYREQKADVGYTVLLPAQRSVFMFDQPYGGFLSFSTIVHEFGHYNQMYWTEPYPTWPDLANVDVGEIHSQGLELLFLEFYDELFGPYEEEAKVAVITSLLDSIVSACMVDELEQYAYAHPEVSLEEFNAAASEIWMKYGGFDVWAPYQWVGYSHIYEQPGYFLGYGISAIAAFQLWEESLGNRREALEDYFIAVEMVGSPLSEVLEECGLPLPFEEGVLENIRSLVEKELGISERRIEDEAA